MRIHPLRMIPPGESLLVGHFRKDSSYGTRRPGGTADWLLIDTVAGGGCLDDAAGSFRVGPGEVVLLRPGTAQAYRTDPDAETWELAWAHLRMRDDWLELLDWPEPRPGLLHLPLAGAAHALVTACIDEAVTWMQCAAARRERLATNAIERALLLLAQHSPADPQAGIDPRLRQAMDRLLRDLTRPLDLAAIARRTGLSPSRFAHLFRDQVGESPARWLEGERLHRAAALLDATTRPIAEIAAEVGYPDPLYFSQRFRRWAGCSPRAWRQRS